MTDEWFEWMMMREDLFYKYAEEKVSQAEADFIAPEGKVWMCGACGKKAKDRLDVGDEACFLNAVLVEE